MEKYMDNFREWLKKADGETQKELKEIENDAEEIKASFSRDMSFGTAGLRGIMRAGSANMNKYTVRHATQGFADYLNSLSGKDKSIVISYDSRINSFEFAKESACVMAANGIKVYIFGELRPTPVLSYAVRKLGCTAGINITASHNPKEYNGYKAYGEDGSQLSLEAADEVSRRIAQSPFFDGVKTKPYDSAVADGDITVLSLDFDKEYIDEVLREQTYPGVFEKVSDDFSVVYSPLHGTGYRLVPEVLKLAGLKKLYTVDEQMVLDGSFPTVEYPNPEFPEVFGIGKKKAEETGAELIVATDPDADRVGICVRRHDGEYVTLSGNQVGALLLEYILTALEERGTLPKGAYAVKSIVSSSLADVICEKHGVKMYNVLTGFKFIGEVITRHEEKGEGGFILGFEESYGYLKGTYARDKDAVVASLIICEMAAYYKTRGMSLYDALESLYGKYGCYLEAVDNIKMNGFDGAEKMKALMDSLRKDPPLKFGSDRLAVIRDYENGTVLDLADGKKTPTGLPISNVLFFITESRDVVVVRPSGTEPKIKIYYMIHSDSEEKAKEKLDAYKQTVNTVIGQK